MLGGAHTNTTKEAPVSEQYADRQIVGIDLHRRRTVIVRMTPAGEKLATVRIDNDPVALGLEIAKAGPDPDVVLEATYGWYWAVDVLQDAGARVHLAHPLGVKGFAYRRVKNDERDAADLADLLRMGRLPEAWIAPPPVRGLREQVRHRAKLVALRSGLKAQVHAVLAKQGVPVPVSDLFGVGGSKLLDQLGLDAPYAARVGSLRRIIDLLDFEIDVVSKRVAAQLSGHDGYQAIQAVPGIGPVLAAVFVAEIGDVTRFRTPAQLACWAGLTPRHRESDTTVHRGSITKQGSRLVRWAAIEAVQRTPGTAGWLVATRTRLTEHRGRNVATVAVARRLLALVFYGLRDGHIRALQHGDRRRASTEAA
jgi:transposase